MGGRYGPCQKFYRKFHQNNRDCPATAIGARPAVNKEIDFVCFADINRAMHGALHRAEQRWVGLLSTTGSRRARTTVGRCEPPVFVAGSA